MNKCRVCVGRTINLAKQPTKATNRSSQNLVFEREPPASCPPVPPEVKIATPHAKRIRLCTGAEMKKICTPKMCDCPPQPKCPKSTFKIILSIIGFGLKSALAGSLVYLTYSFGIWGNADQTELLYSHIMTAFQPPPKCVEDDWDETKIICEELPQITAPHVDRKVYRTKETWNHAVTSVFSVVTELPKLIKSYLPKQECENVESDGGKK